MKTIVCQAFWLIFISLSIPAALLAQEVYPPGFPAFETVEKTFFERYDPGFHSVEAQKKREGYFIVLSSYTDFSPGEPMLFWSAADQAFLPLPLETSEGEGEFWKRSEAAEYDRQPCYGYPGWYRDAIAYLETRQPPTAEELNALARAYGRAASAPLINASNDVDSIDNFRLDPENPALSPRQLAIFYERKNREREAYERLKTMRPHFQTPVGPIATKYANEILDQYLLLCVFGEEKRARADVPHGLYSPFLRESAYNLLQSCPPNAILLTWGDSDTYPLLYLQLTENVRRDVLVANTSLLNLTYYNCYLLRDTVFDAPPPARTMPSKYYADWSILYFQTAPDGDESLSPSRYFQALNGEAYRKTVADGTTEYHLPFQHIAVAGQNLAGWERVEIPANLTDLDRTDTLRIEFDRYATMGTQTIVDWLLTNGWTRPVCFSMTCQEHIWKPFDRYLVQQGLVYRIFPIALQPMQQGAVNSAIDVETTWRLWHETFQWQSRDTITTFDGTPYAGLYFLTTLRLSKALHNLGDDARARAVLDDYCRVFSNERLIWEVSKSHIARAYAAAGDKQSVAAVLSTLYDNYEMNRYDEGDRRDFEDYRDELLGIAKEQGLSQIKKRHRRIFKN